MRSPTRLCALLLTLGFATPALAQDPDPARVEKILEQANSIQKDVEKIRGRAFRTEVPKGVQTRERMKQSVVGGMAKEFAKDETKDAVRVLKVFGFVPDDFDFGEGLMTFYGSQIGGYYDPAAKRLFLIAEESTQPGQELNDGFTMAHELGHALQDQHFDLSRMQRLFLDHEDMTMSFKSVVEGEATLIGYKWLVQRQPMFGRMSLKRFFEMNKQMAEQMPQANPNAELLKSIPPYIIQSAMFPYEAGGAFVEEAVNRAGGWTVVDELFRNPPLSSEQIMHPEKYLGDTKDWPKTQHMLELHEMLGEGWREMLQNTLGEFQIKLLLEALNVPTAQADSAAAGWGGDRYQAILHEEDDRVVVAWLTSWDSKAEAEEFYSVYRRALQTRYGDSGHQVVLQRRDHRVLLIDGAKDSEALDLARICFESYESEARFEVTASLMAPPPLSDFEDALRGDPTAVVADGAYIEDEATLTSFRLPGEGWGPAEEDVRALAQFTRKRFSSKDKTRDLRFLQLPMEYDESSMIERLEGMLRSAGRDVASKGRASLTLQGRKATRVDLQGVLPGREEEVRVALIAVDYDNSTLLFLYGAKPEEWEDADAGLRGMLATLNFGKAVRTESLRKGQRVESAGMVFSIVEPKGWNRRSTPRTPAVILSMGDGKGATVNATFTQSVSKPSAFLSVQGEALASTSFEEYERVRVAFRDFNGVRGCVLDFRARGPSGMFRQRLVTLRFANGAELQLAITVPDERHEELWDTVRGLTDSFVLLNPEARPPADTTAPGPKPTPTPRPSGKAKLY